MQRGGRKQQASWRTGIGALETLKALGRAGTCCGAGLALCAAGGRRTFSRWCAPERRRVACSARVSSPWPWQVRDPGSDWSEIRPLALAPHALRRQQPPHLRVRHDSLPQSSSTPRRERCCSLLRLPADIPMKTIGSLSPRILDPAFFGHIHVLTARVPAPQYRAYAGSAVTRGRLPSSRRWCVSRHAPTSA